ncbi:MAG: GNAT family N-acetyltransferase, partial [Polyangiaceae bacterium]
MEHAIEVRPSCDGDRAAILRIAEQVFGAMPARTLRDEWTWQWQADPRLTRPGHVGVVAECDGRVIASTALQPAGLFRGGVPVEAWWSVNTMVDPGHRRRGIAAQL